MHQLIELIQLANTVMVAERNFIELNAAHEIVELTIGSKFTERGGQGFECMAIPAGKQPGHVDSEPADIRSHVEHSVVRTNQPLHDLERAGFPSPAIVDVAEPTVLGKMKLKRGTVSGLGSNICEAHHADS